MKPHTPKSELKRRSYDPDKLDKENYVATEKLSRQKKLCRDIFFLVFMLRHSFSSFYVATEKIVSRHSFSSFFVVTEKTVSR